MSHSNTDVVTPSTTEQQALKNALNQSVFMPVADKFITPDDIDRRIQQACEQLKRVSQQRPSLIEWLALCDPYDHPDHYNFYFSSRIMMTELIHELDKTGKYLVKLAANPTAAWYVRRKAVNLLSQEKMIGSLEQLIHPILEVSLANKFHTNLELYVAFLKAVVECQITTALSILKVSHKQLSQQIQQAKDNDDWSDLYSLESMEQQLVITCASLGDVAVLVDTIILSHNDWEDVREAANKALDRLLTQAGNKKVLAWLYDINPQHLKMADKLSERYLTLAQQADNPYIRRWTLDRYLSLPFISIEQKTKHLMLLLGDKNWYVASRATEQLISHGEASIPVLQDAMNDTSIATTTKYWVLYALLKLNVDISALMGISKKPLARIKYLKDKITLIFIKEDIP